MMGASVVRNHRRQVRNNHFNVDATITPETHLKVSLVQMGAIIVAIFFVAVGYAYLTYNIVDIKSTQVDVLGKTAIAVKEQDEKRVVLGKQFIDSNEKIALAISTLATQMAVQQERQRSTDEKLEKVLIQISTTLSPSLPASRR
jgi:uncharacterized protein (UPF0264 family)